MIEVQIIGQVSGPLSMIAIQEKIEALETECLKYPQVDVPVKEYYVNGIYIREIVIPADCLLTGEIYKDNHFDIMVSGSISVSSDQGVKQLSGFHLLESFAGKKRAGYTHEETHWLTINQIDSDNPGDDITVKRFADLENGYIDEVQILSAFSGNDADYPAFREGYILGKGKPSKIDADWLDYARFLDDIGCSEVEARASSENTADQIDYPMIGVFIAKSLIEGRGLFSGCNIRKGSVIMRARISGKRTPAGRYTNHSIKANAAMVPRGADIDLVALRDIEKEEITVNYRHPALLLEKVS